MRNKRWVGVEESHMARNTTDILVAAKLPCHLRYGFRRGGGIGVGAEYKVDRLFLREDGCDN